MISYSSCAKVILSGEHAVVYGKPALVCGLNKRLKFSLFPTDKKNYLKPNKDILFISSKVIDYLKKEKIKFNQKKFTFKIESQIPIGRGLGSSAALAVTSVASFLHFYTGKSFNKEIINNLAFEVEKYFHGNPSGVDNSTSCFGGLIFYRKEFDFLKNIYFLDFKIPKSIQDHLFLIDSGKPVETTRQMVQIVKNNIGKKPNYYEQIFNEIEKITKKMLISIKEDKANDFIQSLIDNEIYLEMLGVVSLKTKALLKNLEKFGIGKITGAGGVKEGSGFILFYALKSRELENYLKKQKINYFKFIPDYQGLKYENNN
jgi:mevalonate kinase